MSKPLVNSVETILDEDQNLSPANKVICGISIILFIGALIVNGTLGAKTGKISNEVFPLAVTPPGFAFAIWGVIFTTTMVALIWVCWNAIWTVQSHLWFWGYCGLISLWIYLWSKATVPTMTASSVVLILLSIDLLMLWRSTINWHESTPYYLMRSTIAFQLGWTASAQCLNICTYLVYAQGFSQETIASLIWPILAISHAAIIFVAYITCHKRGNSFILNFGGYFLSMSWALMGVLISWKRM